MRGPGSKPSLLFQLVIPATAVFIVTILSLIAVLFSDERAPLARLLNRHGNSLLAAELVVFIVLAFCAMALDRRQTLRDAAKIGAGNLSESGDRDSDLSNGADSSAKPQERDDS